MTRPEDLLEEIRGNPNNVRFEKLDRLLRLYGLECRVPRGGSHCFYKRKGCRPISVPRARPVKRVYVKQVIALIEQCEGLTDTE